MPNPVRKVRKLGVDNTRSICAAPMLSRCIVMEKPEHSDSEIVIVNGETLNDTLERMWSEVLSMRKQLKAAQAEIKNLKALNNK